MFFFFLLSNIGTRVKETQHQSGWNAKQSKQRKTEVAQRPGSFTFSTSSMTQDPLQVYIRFRAAHNFCRVTSSCSNTTSSPSKHESPSPQLPPSATLPSWAEHVRCLLAGCQVFVSCVSIHCVTNMYSGSLYLDQCDPEQVQYIYCSTALKWFLFRVLNVRCFIPVKRSSTVMDIS